MPMCMCNKQQLGMPRSALIITVRACLAACVNQSYKGTKATYPGGTANWPGTLAAWHCLLQDSCIQALQSLQTLSSEPLGRQAHVGFHESSPEKPAAATLLTAVLQRLRRTGCSSEFLTAESGSVTVYLCHVSR